jgi:glycosyltransferase involved in cell wall biosynthesis
MRKKYAYIKLGSHPVNNSIMQMLEKHFPDMDCHLIDVGRLLRAKKLAIMVNMFYVLKEYGLEILRAKKTIQGCFWRTTYIFDKMRSLVSNELSKQDFVFSFQNQSLFDGSKENLPHYVYTDHAHLANLYYPGFQRKDLYSSCWIELEKSIYKHATLVFTRSNYAAKSIIEDYLCPPEKVICVYAGGNAGANFEINRGKYQSKNILFVGGDWERKGGPDLVKAFKRVMETYPTAQLTIVGCSPRLNIVNCVVVGRVPPYRVNDYYEMACVFCLPSRLEPSAGVLLEAAAHALPVVATDVGGTTERVINEKTGYLVDPGNAIRLSEVLISLLGNPEQCRVLGENGRRLVRAKYNWENVGADIAKNIIATLGETPERKNPVCSED